MLKRLQLWVRLPSFRHEINRVTGGNPSPPSAAQMGDGEPSSRQQRPPRPGAWLPVPSGSVQSCLQWKAHPGGEGRSRDPVRWAVRGSQRA